MRVLDPKQLPTVRGTIYDRHGRKLAVDRPVFYLHVNYELTRLMDDRFWEGNIMLKCHQDPEKNPRQVELELREKYEPQRAKLMNIINRFAELQPQGREKIEKKIRHINDVIFKSRAFHAWSRNYPDSAVKKQYRERNRYVPQSVGLEDFEKKQPDYAKRMAMIMKVNLAEMHSPQPIIELKTEQELLEAQMAFSQIQGVEIFPEAKRVYPYDNAACQLIGRVWPAYDADNEIFGDDDYSTYQHGDVLGKFGIEYVCEVVLRGKRGEVQYDIDGNVISRKPTIFGKDVSLTIDIQLQKQIEQFLSSDPNAPPIGVAVQDVASADMLVMASMPTYNLNTMRNDYDLLLHNENRPLWSKVTQAIYPPGSVMKPFILVIGLEEHKVDPWEVISCPYQSAPRGWPDCLQFSRFHGCHDWKWEGQGGNRGRNAIKGSCNIYFSRLANRVDSKDLQRWLYYFGYGRKILTPPPFEALLEDMKRTGGRYRKLPESQGIISSQMPPSNAELKDLPPIKSYEKRMFGIGQGSLRATVLQIANAMTALSKSGLFRHPNIFTASSKKQPEYQSLNLGLSKKRTIATLRDGMYAVVNEPGGTAYNAFKNSVLMDKSLGLRIYGKTGSTEKPYNALFAGFVEDKSGRAVSIAVVVEGGQAGSQDAAPLAVEIIKLCNQAGYIGTTPSQAAAESDY